MTAPVTPAAPAQPHPAADAIYLHGNILTGVDLETAHPQRVSAIAVAHGEILGAGTDAEIKARFQSPATQIVDLHGAFVMPGFNDAHAHLGMGGRIRLSVDLIGVKSLAEMQARIRAAAQKAPPGQWLTGGGWDHTLWPDKQTARRDRTSTPRPRVIPRSSPASTATLPLPIPRPSHAAGITKSTQAPEGGEIDHGPERRAHRHPARDSPGSGTGYRHQLPEQRRHGLELALEDAYSHGVTTSRTSLTGTTSSSSSKWRKKASSPSASPSGCALPTP